MITRQQAARVMRVLRNWDSASAMDLAEGLDWYQQANALAHELATLTGLDVTRTAGAIAALSPRTRWATNAASARTMAIAVRAGSKEPNVPGYPANRTKAWRILTEPDTPVLDILHGPKVEAFYANILGDEDAVTVDIWAARAAEGHHFDASRALAGKYYRAIADAYRLAAQARDVSPRDMQAAVWVNERRVDAGKLFNWEKEF